MYKALRYTVFAPVALSLSAFFSPCFASVVYDESINGDLSTDFSNPTSVLIQAGSNQILGTTGRADGVVDRDYFTITIPQGLRLTRIEVLPNTTGDNIDTPISFISVQTGATGTNPSTAQAPLAASLLGYYLFGPADIGQDILDNLGQSNLLFLPAQGFTTPLGAGTYTFWVQETAVNLINYGIDLQVQPVPVPAAVWLFGSGLIGLFHAKRKPAGRSHKVTVPV